LFCFFFFQAEDGIRDPLVTGVQTCALPIFPLVIAMAAGGAGVLNTVEHAAEPLPDGVRWLLVGSLAAAVASVALLTWTLEVRSRSEERRVGKEGRSRGDGDRVMRESSGGGW